MMVNQTPQLNDWELQIKFMPLTYHLPKINHLLKSKK